MSRGAALPDRCVACNAPANGYRQRRTLYCSPLAWRIAAFVAPFACFALGAYTNEGWLMAGILLLPVPLAIVHALIRKSLKVEIGVCKRHRRLRNLMVAISIPCIASVGFAVVYMIENEGGGLLLLAAIAALFVVMFAASSVGAQRTKLHAVSREHAWLAGLGDAFRGTLPEQH
jgi:heme exporter protein D